MEINEMTMEQVEARLAELDPEAEGADLEALSAEMDALEARKKEIIAEAEARQAALDEAAKEPITKPIMEEKKMNFEIDSKEYRNLWLKNLAGQPLTEEERAYATTDSHTAIPTLVADKFFEKMKKLAPMMNEITLMRVAGNLKFIAEGTRVGVSAHTENQTVSAAGDTIVSVTLGAAEFVKVIKISKAAANQSIDAFEDWLVEMLSGDIARTIDNYIINDSTKGIAHGTFTTNTNQILNTATTGYTYSDLCDLVGLLPAGYDAEAKFLVNKKVLWSKIKGILDTSKKPIFDPEAKTLMGYPVLVDDYVSTANNALYLGAFNNVVGNLSEGVNVERNDSAAFADAAIMFRGYAAFDSAVANPDAIVRLVSTTA